MEKRIYFWPDGTEHTESYQDYMNSTITPVCRFWRRLIFILKKLHFFVRHFKNIEVSKKLDSSGNCVYETKFALPVDFVAKKVISPEFFTLPTSGDIGFADCAHTETESDTKSF